MNRFDWQGQYYGTPRCSIHQVCLNVETTLTLMKGNHYELRALHLWLDSLNQSHRQVLFDKGNFVWSGNKIKLLGLKEIMPTEYKIEQDQVILLDWNGHDTKNSYRSEFILTKTGNEKIEDRRWKLMELNGKKINGNGQTHYVIFHSQNSILEAKAGCNQLNNHYTIKNGSELSISQGISTLMACPNQEIEEEFTEMLTEADQFAVDNDELILKKGTRSLAVFTLDKEDDFHWIIGKTFIQEGTQDFDPKLGGPSFVRFESKEGAGYKVGDIMAPTKVTLESNKIILEEILTGRKHEFTVIKNKYLKDETGTNWISK
jgi:heat shock protein HslJ